MMKKKNIFLKRLSEIVNEKASLQAKYGLSILPDPDESNSWRLMAIDKSPIKRIKQDPAEDILPYSDITLTVNLSYDKEILVNEFKKTIDDILRRKGKLIRKERGIKTESGKPIFLRHFAVYDFMNTGTFHRNPSSGREKD